MVKIEPTHFNDKGMEEALKQASSATKSLYSNIDIAKTASVLTGVSAMQNAVKITNLSNIAITAMRSNLEQMNQVINQSSSKLIKESISGLPKNQLESIRNMTEAAQQAFRNIDIDYSKLINQITKLAETLKTLPKPYSKEEVAEIVLKIKALAEKGWVIYFHLDNMYQRIDLEDITVLENKWVSLLENVLSNDTKIQRLRESECYSGELIQSMVECYLHENYYAAYTLASLAIDGAVNRFSELNSNGNRFPVGYKAVKQIEEGVLEKTFNDIGLIHWLFKFFEDTNQFTLDKPNRHMIGHGRWESEISRIDFLKLFNVMLYIWEEFPYWKESAIENSLEVQM